MPHERRPRDTRADGRPPRLRSSGPSYSGDVARQNPLETDRILALQRDLGNSRTTQWLAARRRGERLLHPASVQRDDALTVPAMRGGSRPSTNWGQIVAAVQRYNSARNQNASLVRRRELLDRVEHLLRSGKHLDQGFRGLRHRDARRAKRADAQNLLAEIATARAAQEREQVMLHGTFDGIGDEIWRQYIDLRRQHFGSAVFDEGLHGKPPEPGYLASMGGAHVFLARLLGRRMTPELYEKLQRETRRHSNDDTMAGWSTHTDHVDADKSTAGPGFLEAYAAAWGSNASLEEIYARLQSRSIPMGDAIERIYTTATMTTVNFAFKYPDKGESASKQRLQKLFDDFYDEVEVSDNKLQVIARPHKNLEYLHPFKDANTRTNLALLNKLLVEYGFEPVILDDPNQSYTQTVDEWAGLLQRGMDRWSEVLLAQVEDLDVTKAMLDFDTENDTPARNRLKQQDDRARDLEGVEDLFES